MSRFLFVTLVLLPLLAQPQPGPAIAIDASAARHAISPDIYGVNEWGDSDLAPSTRITLRRWGGDNTVRYNWKIDAWNTASNWYFSNYPASKADPEKLPHGSAFDQFVEKNRARALKSVNTIPMIGWGPRNRDRICSFAVSKYGPQEKTDPWNGDCGNGRTKDGKDIKNNDPADASERYDEAFQQEWVRHIVSKYGSKKQGGVAIYALDNEPVWWMGVHRDVHPNPATYEEVRDLGIKYAKAILAEDPDALIAGPVSAGWESIFYSALDLVNGWGTPPWKYWSNPVDRKAHGGLAFTPWYLQEFRKHEVETGQRLLHYLDLHAYIHPPGIGFGQGPGDEKLRQLRLTSTRVFWDPEYRGHVAEDTGEAFRLIPRMREWVDEYYPGTKLALTEYNWGALDDISGALAQADLLGIFGRERLDAATIWGTPKPEEPGAFAFAIFRNYDGRGGAFGETSVSAVTDDADRLSVFAAERSDGALTLLVINKTTSDLESSVSLANFAAAESAEVWRYSAKDLAAIVREENVAVGEGAIRALFPASSLTLLVVPRDPTAYGTPQPVVETVVNAASGEAGAVAPGEFVTIRGTALGPEEAVDAKAGETLPFELGGVRAWFEGFPAPLQRVSAGEVTVAVPFAAGLKPGARLVVEFAGRRAEPVDVEMVASAPGLFPEVAREDGSLVTAESPATPGDTVIVFATGGGQTVIPSVDAVIPGGSASALVLPCRVFMQGIGAEVKSCTAAPDRPAGVVAIKAVVPAGVPSDPSVPVQIFIGDALAPNSAPLAIR